MAAKVKKRRGADCRGGAVRAETLAQGLGDEKGRAFVVGVVAVPRIDAQRGERCERGGSGGRDLLVQRAEAAGGEEAGQEQGGGEAKEAHRRGVAEIGGGEKREGGWRKRGRQSLACSLPLSPRERVDRAPGARRVRGIRRV